MREKLPIDAAKNDFVAMVTHELRAPLTSIQATVKLVASGFGGETTPAQQEMLSSAVTNIERMGRMINQLLDYTKIEAGHLELNRQRTDLVSIVRDVIRSFEPLAMERGLALILHPCPASLESFLDRDKTVQILTNLLHNAIKFTPAGQVKVGLTEQAGEIVLVVSDTGPGFQAQDLPLVFGRFKRFRKSVRPEDQGSGLGLALTKRLIELQGGTIGVDSKPGEGACFTIHFRRSSAEEVFKREVQRLVQRAQETAAPFSIAEVSLKNWPDLRRALGEEAATTLLYHLEAQLKSSLRGDSDYVIQRPGGLWLAIFSATKAEAEGVLQRVIKMVQKDALARETARSISVSCRLASFPQDGQNSDELLARLRFPLSEKLASS